MTNGTTTRFSMGARGWALLAALLLWSLGARAAYLTDVPQALTQPDGLQVSCFVTGDEYYHWLHDAQGHVIVRDPRDGSWVYARKEEGRLVPSPYAVGRTDPLDIGIEPRLMPDPAFIKADAYRPATGGNEVKVPTTGTLSNLVIFIRFSDQVEFGEAISLYDDKFNSMAAGADSLASYFFEASYTQISIQSAFYPPASGGMVVSVQDTQPRAYYQPYDATANPVGYQPYTDDRDNREHSLLASAVNAVASQVPAGAALDADGDGFVDSVVFIIAGSPDPAWNSLLWPHKSQLSWPPALLNGKQVWNYDFQLQTSTQVGVLCHEMFHTLGAPDLYHYSSCSADPALSSVGPWDPMDATADPPQHMGAYMKYKYGKWIAAIPEITAPGTYTLNPLTSPDGNAYTIASPYSATEYFIVEYRKKTGEFEGGIPGSGLLVYRINAPQNGDACGPPDEVYIYRPQGTPTATGNLPAAFYTSDAGRTAINDTTAPSAFLTDGTGGGLDLFNITSAGSTISFSVDFNGAAFTPASASHAAAGGTGSVNVASDTGRPWTVASDASWLTVPGGGNGTGGGTLAYTVAANTTPMHRTGHLYVPGARFTVDQDGGNALPACISETFESGAPGWTASGLWHLSTTCQSVGGSHGTPTSYYFGGDATCTYDAGVTLEGQLYSPSIYLTDVTGFVELEFNYYLHTAQYGIHDLPYLNLWDGSKWIRLDRDQSSGGTLNDEGVWSHAEYDLSAYAGRTIVLLFMVDSPEINTGHAFEGWYIDDVKVSSATCTLCPRPKAGNNGPLCAGATLNLTASAIDRAAYAWTGPNGFASRDQNPVIAGAAMAEGGLYAVTATLNGYTTPASATLVAVDASLPAPVLTGAAGTCSSVNVSWAPVTGAASYIVYRGSACGPAQSSFTNVTGTLYADTTAVSDVTGMYWVAGVNSCGTGAPSACASGTRSAVPSAPVAGNNGPICLGQTLYLTASTLAGASYVWTGPNGFSSTLQNPSVPYTTGMAAGFYTVTATVGGCPSAAATTNAKICTGVPTTPAAPAFSNPTCSTVTIGWAKIANASGYTVFRMTGACGTTASKINASPVSVTIYADTGLAAGTRYSYYVVAVNGCGASSNGFCGSVTTANPVSAPTADNNGPLCAGSTLLLTASDSPGAVYAWSGPSNFSSTLQNPGIAEVTTGASGVYMVTITVNGCTSAAASTTATITPGSCPPPGEVASGAKAANVPNWSSDKSTQSWPAVTGASVYSLYRGTLAQLPALLTSATDSCTVYSGPAMSASDSSTPAEGRVYWYLIIAGNPCGQGPAGDASAGARVVNSSGDCG